MKKTFYIVLVIGFVFVLAGCGGGSKSPVDVKEALNEKMKGIQGYKISGVMNIKVGADPQSYRFDVWYQAPNNYRVSLQNQSKNQNQIILRNKQGVYVLTPALNKSYHFQSDWPDNGGQAYLYQSLIKDIHADKHSKYTEKNNQYVFEAKTRYANNKMLPTQEITFSKKNLAPLSVKVMDTDRNSLVTVKFDKAVFNPNFGKSDFDVQKNMTGAQIQSPNLSATTDTSFEPKYPIDDVTGALQTGEKLVKLDGGEKLVLTYQAASKSYTLVEKRATVAATSTPITEVGEPVDLGFAIGTLSEHALSWTDEGVDYLLASNDLTQDELIAVASTVQASAEK